MMHWLYHALAWTWGGDGWGDGNAPGYLVFSGPLPDVTLLGAAVTFYLKHNCHARGCPRVGKHPVEGTPFKVCRKHHPTVPSGGATVAEIHAAHADAQSGAIKVREGK